MEDRRVLIADDSPAFRQALRALLDRTSGIAVVAEADDGWQALEQAEAAKPDVVLMDMMMPVMDGLFATRLLKERTPETFVIVMSIRGDEGVRRAAAAAGADAFVWKGNLAEELSALSLAGRS